VRAGLTGGCVCAVKATAVINVSRIALFLIM
jgi:hypothetical protein